MPVPRAGMASLAWRPRVERHTPTRLGAPHSQDILRHVQPRVLASVRCRGSVGGVTPAFRSTLRATAETRCAHERASHAAGKGVGKGVGKGPWRLRASPAHRVGIVLDQSLELLGERLKATVQQSSHTSQ